MKRKAKSKKAAAVEVLTIEPQTKPVAETCSGCAYYTAVISGTRGECGSCHRYPPRDSAVLGSDRWPNVFAVGWCGEYKGAV